MKLRERILRNRKNHRVIGAWLTVLLLLSAALFYLAERGRDLPATLVTNRVLLFVLWYVNVVLILVFLFVLLRNLIKLLVERQHRVLGSTFKFKLVATYIGLSLIPVLLLFAIATELLQGSIDRWFNTPVAPVLGPANAGARAPTTGSNPPSCASWTSIGWPSMKATSSSTPFSTRSPASPTCRSRTAPSSTRPPRKGRRPPSKR